MDVSAFDYDLPDAAIAQHALEPRDASRLLVASSMEDRRFRDLPALLDPGDLVVVNRTRVRACRLRGTRAGTGGRVEVLLTRRVDDERWEALIRPARRMRPGVELDLGALRGEVLTAPEAGVVTVRVTADAGVDVEKALEASGEVPLPPYFTGTLDDPERYQTVFAVSLGSAAAPTAALHFTPGVVSGLRRRGIDLAEVELDVGLDTFRPMAGGRVEDHVIHRERFEVPPAAAAAVAAARARGGAVVAVGTTVVRTLETTADGDGGVRASSGESSLFITPGYRFRVVDRVVTNFHAPRTTLIALVAAFTGPAWREIYRIALERGYRFLSFGDAVLLDPAERRLPDPERPKRPDRPGARP